MLEPAVRTGEVAVGHEVLGPLTLQVEAGLEVRLAEQRSSVPGLLPEVRGDAGRVGGEGHTVRDNAVRADVLAGEHRRTGRHARGVLVVRAFVPNAIRGEPVDDGCARDRASVAPERVVPLLV